VISIEGFKVHILCFMCKMPTSFGTHVLGLRSSCMPVYTVYVFCSVLYFVLDNEIYCKSSPVSNNTVRVVGFCECSNETLVSIKVREFFDWLKLSFSRRALLNIVRFYEN